MSRAVVAALALALLAGPAVAATPPHRYAGRPLVEALEALRADGLPLVWSSALVRAEMRVANEPRASAPREVLDELLAPFPLAVRPGPSRRLLIVARAEPPALGSLAGTVRRADSRAPLADAEVVVPALGRRARSGRDGAYRLGGLPPGAYRVQARRVGFVVAESDGVEVAAGVERRADFDLVPAPLAVDRIVVTPNRYAILGDDPAGREALSRERVEALPHLGDDLFRTLPWVPGVSNGDFSAQVHVRGGEQDEVLVELDGLRLYSPFHFKDFQSVFSLIDAQAVGGVEFLSGGFPAEYGDRLSGVIDVTSATPIAPRRSEVGISFTHALALTEGASRSGRWRWLVAGRRGYLDLVLDLVGARDVQLNPRYFDTFAKVEVDVDERTTLALEALAAHDSLHFASDSRDQRAEASYGDRYAWARAQTAWSSRLLSQSLVSAATVDRDRRGTVATADLDADVADRRGFRALGLAQDWTFQPSPRLLVRWGGEVRRLTASYDYTSRTAARDPFFPPASDDLRVVLDPAGETYGAFASLRLRVARAWTLELGGRWDRQSYTAGRQLSPRVNAVWQARPGTTVHLAWGRFAQSQGIDELQVEDGVDRFYPAQWSEHRIVGIEQDLGRGVHLAVSAYQKRLSHLRPRFENLFTPIELLPEAEPDRVQVAATSGRAEGVELLLRGHGGGPLAWSLAYTLASASDEVDGRRVPRSWDQRHALVANAELRLGPAWRLSLGAVVHSGWPTTPVSATVVTGADGGRREVLAVGERNSRRNPVYERLDLRAVRGVSLRAGELDLVLEVTNLFNRGNVCCVDTFRIEQLPDGDVAVHRRDVDWLPRVPSFGVAWRF